ncbi:hypothetical protein KC19_4G188900 [Ceratodon purpureus]|uniref:Uncharacterized protein n=1 Tax=Ceratodon purpureus TaxID=3225 RepID=A0A8T0IA65_CERPU|nr:hypothetical protein KC19_4G188900 [Ceratodon purpureus]
MYSMLAEVQSKDNSQEVLELLNRKHKELKVDTITQGICKEYTGKNKDSHGILRHTGKTEFSLCLIFPFVSQFSLCVFVLPLCLFTNPLCMSGKRHRESHMRPW